MPIEKLQAFYRNYYQPDNAMLVVAGKFDPRPKRSRWINETFGAIPKPTRKLIPTYTEEPTQDGEREVILRRVGDSRLVMMAYHIPAGSHPDAAALEVLADIMGDRPPAGFTKRWSKPRRPSPPAPTAISSTIPAYLMFDAQLRKDGSLDDAEKTMLSVIDGVVKEPPSKDEVDRARTRLLKNIELSLNNSAARRPAT